MCPLTLSLVSEKGFILLMLTLSLYSPRQSLLMDYSIFIELILFSTVYENISEAAI